MGRVCALSEPCIAPDHFPRRYVEIPVALAARRAGQKTCLKASKIESPAPVTWKTSSRRYCAGIVQKSRRQRFISRRNQHTQPWGR